MRRRKSKTRQKRRGGANAKKFKTVVAVIVEVVIMAVKVLSCLLPRLWQLGILIAAGARSVLLRAARKHAALPANAKGHKVLFTALIELAITVAEILCCLLPMPWRLAVPIVIGARSIILQAIYEYNKPRCSCGAGR